MAKTVQDAYSEILRLRNEFYQQWQEVPLYDENRDAYKAKYEAFVKVLELLTPSIVDPQPEEPIEYNPFDDFRHTDSEEPVSEDMESEFLRALHNLREQPTLSAWFKHFYNLGKQQMMKDAVDAFIYKGGIRLKEWPLREKYGEHLDPVKVIIIKEDKV